MPHVRMLATNNHHSAGSTYVYSGVPESTAQEIMNADSKGSYFNREIKPNFECRQA